ncbi:MAG: alpha/beta hydrolase [Verrucomicrobia bacterium]|nr:alpha/beta hydrolase [Verrucomicrobiota bacterium]
MFKGEERIFDIPGFSLTAREWGPPDGIPVLAIHGWLDNAGSFDFLAPLLPQMHIIAIDCPGCGHSTHKPVSAIPNIIEEPFYMYQVADLLGWEKFSIIGHSRGGVVAELMAAGWPERTQLLTLLDISGFHLVGTSKECVEYWQNALHEYLTRKIKPGTIYPDMDALVKERMKTYPLAYESALTIAKRGTKEVDGGYTWAFDRKELLFRSPTIFAYEMAEAMLNSIKAPTAFIMGEQGYLKMDKNAVDLYPKWVPNHKIYMLPGGHHVHMDNATAVAACILEFYKANNLIK